MLGPSRRMKFSPQDMIQEFTQPTGARAAGASVASDEARTIVVTLQDNAVSSKSAQKTLSNSVGLKSLNAASAAGGESVAALGSSEGLYLPNLGVIIMRGDLNQAQNLVSIAGAEDNDVLLVTPERKFYAINEGGFGDDYLLGYRDGVGQLVDKLLNKGGTGQPGPMPTPPPAEAAGNQPFTYGVVLTGASTSSFSGDGARVAILDTGIDLNHPDFYGPGIIRRVKETASFVGGTVMDAHGHGTHCAGTACGPRTSQAPLATRYGVAYEADLYIGKVLADNGGSVGSSVVLGMDWAAGKQCHVISMSLGSGSSQVYQEFEIYGGRALAKGCLVVAAAGNNASRPLNVGFVESPANCRTVLAVGGIDRNSSMYVQSGRSNTVSGGYVDVAAPGVQVYSSMPVARGSYGFMTGTSMSTPHVAGIAALWHQKTQQTGAALALALHQNAKSLSLNSLDVGKGLVQAPQS
jgi:subtilisin family serine protease